MSNIFTFKRLGIGTLWHGNNLDGQHPPTATHSSPVTAKRPATSDSTAKTPSKRRRTEEEDVYDVHLIPSSPDAPEKPRPAKSTVNRRNSRDSTSLRSTSPPKKGPHDSQSLRSSGDRQSNGVGNSEYRTTAKYVDGKTGGKRSRHSKKRPNLENGHSQHAQETWHAQKPSQGPPIRANRPLMQNREVRGDPIEHDEIEIVEERRAPKQRQSASGYTGARFRASLDMGFSEDEVSSDSEQDEIAQLPVSEKHEPTKQRQETHQMLDRRKRRAPSPDELQSSREAKRISRPANQAGLTRNHTVADQASGSRRGKPNHRVLKIKGAVCEPRFIYPARDGMYENELGASNSPCVLSPTGSLNSIFRPVNDSIEDLTSLTWMTPYLSRVTRIAHNKKSPIVQVKSMQDNRPESLGGSMLLLKFEDNEDAGHYVELCEKANRNIFYSEQDPQKLEKIFSNQLDQVKKSNIAKGPPTTENLKLPHRLENIGERYEKQAQPKSRSTVEADQAKDNTQKTTMRKQMMDDSEVRPGTPMSKGKSQQRTSITPADEKQMRSLVSEFDSSDGKEETEFLLKGNQNKSLLQGVQTATTRPQRSLRSSQPAARSPSPSPERWTQVNPDWVDNRKWLIPLIYERTTVNSGDITCLDEGQFLNDAIITFYAKYLHKELEKRDEKLAKKVYIFNSFFWETWRSKGYDGVKSWTAKVDLLSYDYIIVPINQHAHWYLAIICNPGALIPKDEPDDEVQEVVNDRNGNDAAQFDDETEAKVANITSDLSQVSIEDQPEKLTASHPDRRNGTPVAKRSKASKRRIPPRKYDPKAPRVITLDSLDGTHSAVASQLKAYLVQEIKERKGLEVEAPSPFGTTAKDIPMQNNFTDCGVYLLGYIEEFMKDPHKFARRILQQEKRDWNVNAPELRHKIREVIFERQQKHQQEENQRRKEKRSLNIQKQTKTQDSATAEPTAKPTADSKQDTRKASRSPAVERQNTPRSTGSPTLHVNGSVSVNGSGNGSGNGRRAESKTSNTKSPTPRVQPSSPSRSPPSQDKEGPDLSASMIVHPNVSIEFVDELEPTQNRTNRTPREEKSAPIDVDAVRETPKPKKSTESRQTPVARQASASRQVSGFREASESRQVPRDRSAKGEYDERSFLPPLVSSPSASPAPTLRQSAERQHLSPASMAGKHTTPKQENARSKYFPVPSSSSSSTMKSSSNKVTHSARRNGNGNTHHVYHPVDSSDDEAERQRRKSKEKRKSKPSREHIDLTED